MSHFSFLTLLSITALLSFILKVSNGFLLGSKSSVVSSILHRRHSEQFITLSMTQPRTYGLSAGYKPKKNEINKPTDESFNIQVTPSAVTTTNAIIQISDSAMTTKKSYGLSSGYKPVGSSLSSVTASSSSSSPNSKDTSSVTPSSQSIVESNVLTSFIELPTELIESTSPPVAAPITEKAKEILTEFDTGSITKIEEDEEFSFKFLSELNYEQKLKKQAEAEIMEYKQTYNNLENLKLNLQKSISKKEEAENMIITELNELRPLLNQELTLYENRAKNLQNTMIFLNNAIINKENQISAEKELLIQMTEIRNKIYEKRILSEYNVALTKKQELIVVDQQLLGILQDYIKIVQDELSNTNNKYDYLRSKNNNFPRENDRASMLKYSWSDIADIQQVLLSAEDLTKTWRQADDSMKKLIDTLNLVETKRNFILEENTVLPTIPVVTPSSVQTAVTSTSTSSVTTKTNTPADVEKKSNNYGIQIYDPSIYQRVSLSNGYSIVKLPKSEWNNLVREKSPQEVATLVSNVMLLTLNSLAILSVSLVESAIKFTSTEEASESKKALDLTVNAASNINKNIGSAVSNITNTWTETMKAEPETSTDEYILKLFKSSQKVLNNDNIKTNLIEALKNTQKSVIEASTATATATTGLSTQLQDNDKFNNAVTNLMASINFFSTVILTSATKSLGGNSK